MRHMITLTSWYFIFEVPLIFHDSLKISMEIQYQAGSFACSRTAMEFAVLSRILISFRFSWRSHQALSRAYWMPHPEYMLPLLLWITFSCSLLVKLVLLFLLWQLSYQFSPLWSFSLPPSSFWWSHFPLLFHISEIAILSIHLSIAASWQLAPISCKSLAIEASPSRMW